MSRQSEQAKTTDYEILGAMEPGFDEILTPDAMRFVVELTRRFAPKVEALLERRRQRQQEINQGNFPDFLAGTRQIRASDWQVGSIPADLQDRRVEITGPTDRKMVINALNSGARVFMADCEDSLTPTWSNVIQGQINLRDAISGEIDFTSPEGKRYQLAEEHAVLIVRPRGWHLFEKHILVDGKRVPGAFVDFGLYLFHNAETALKRGTGPYFYLPKLEGHQEARLWTEVFEFSENYLGLRHGTIKCTVLIETILAAFEIDEILYALKDYIVGLNCGRWDYIFSFIKKFQKYPDFVLPERSQVTMTTHFLRSYSQLVIKTCHHRGALAIGGMAAQIPIKGDEAANEAAIAKVRQDKEREAGDGHDGTWVAHPGLVGLALEVFDQHMPGPNQLSRLREDVTVNAADLLAIPPGNISESGLRHNINIAIRYMAAWLGGNGCVPIYNLMEDAATAEISRAQIWQWIRHPRGELEDGRRITLEMYENLRDEELASIRKEVGEQAFAGGHYEQAASLLDGITREDEFIDFLTLVAYEAID
ncbi:MAG: malate synthase A [Gammaproteobacteria bacterium]